MGLIEFVIGDWSGDGHSMSEKFIVESSHSLFDIRKAYKKGVAQTGIDLFEICNEYQEGQIPKEAIPLFDHVEIDIGYEEEITPSVEEFFQAILKLIRIGNEEIEFKELKTQCFNGWWSKDEIDGTYFNNFFGYGLF